MLKISKVSLLLAAAVAMMGVSTVQADVVAYQGFEGSASDTWGYANPSTSGWAIAGTSGLFPASSLPVDGSNTFQSSNTTTDLIFQAVNVSGYSNLSVNVPVASFSRTSGDGNDSADYVAVFIALDGSNFSSTPDIKLFGLSNAKWNFTATGVLSTTAGTDISTSAPYSGNTNSNLQYGLLNITLPAGVTSVALKVEMFNSASAGEVWATDGVSVTGSAVPEPASLSLLAIGGGLLLRRRQAFSR